MYSVFNYFKKVDKLETILDLQTPMSSVDKKHPSVKERFRRLKERLLSDNEKNELKKTKPIIKGNFKKDSSDETSVAGTRKQLRRRKLPAKRSPSPKKGNVAKLSLVPTNNVKPKEEKKPIPPLVISNASCKSKKKRYRPKKKVKDEHPATSNKKPKVDSIPQSLKKVAGGSQVTFNKNQIAERMKKFQKQIVSQIQSNQLTSKTILNKKDQPIRNIQQITRQSNVLNKTIAKEAINNNYKIPKKNDNKVFPSLPSLNPDEDLMEVDITDLIEEPDNVQEMDWEVNEIRKDLYNHDDSRNSLFLGNCQGDGIELPLVLVIDTNIYISSLPFVEKLCEIEIQGYGAPVVYVPRRVLSELDGLKQNVTNSVKNPKLPISARKAINFLNSHLSKGSERIKGQTMEQYKALENLNMNDSDDKILLSCLQLKQLYCDKRVILLSNDVNLRSKAIIESVESFSANEFDDQVISNDASSSMEHQIDSVLKAIFYEIISVECKCKAHYNTLKLAVASFLSNWPNVFSYLSPVAAEENLKRLKLVIEDSKVDYLELMETAKKFLSHFLIKSKPYYIKVEKALNQINNALCQLRTIKTQENSKKGCEALQEIFQQCWIILQDELNKGYNESTYSTVSEHISKIIVDFGNSINGILAFASEDHIKILASSIRICLNGSVETYSEIVHAVIRSEEGRNMTLPPQPTTLDGLPIRFVNAMRTLFDILDDQRKDCVRFSDIQQFWQDDGSKGLPKGVIESLQKVTPPSGLLTFERFCAGLKICLLRNQIDPLSKSRKSQPPDYQKTLSKRPPSAPALDNPDLNIVTWSNTATVRPNNAMASRTLSMPQLLPGYKDNFSSQTESRHSSAAPYYSTGSAQPLYGPPKPPRSAILLDRPHIDRNPMQEQLVDRTEIRNALHNWQKEQILQEQEPTKSFLRGRSSGDGKPSGYTDAAIAPKKPLQRRREPRRHTLQNGIDYNMLKRIKQIEHEKEMLLDGLSAVDRAREWYLKQITIVQEKMKYLGRVGPAAEPWSEAHAERLELQKARVLEVNRHLATLTESWERGGLPLHMNLAVHHLASSDLSRVKHQNHLLTKEVSEKSERITVLEQEKTALVRELYSARSRMQGRTMSEMKPLHDRGALL